MKPYITIKADRIDDLVYEVSKRIPEGYRPLNGPIEINEQFGYRYAQTMFREPVEASKSSAVELPDITLDQALEVLRHAFNIRFKLVVECANLRGEQLPGCPGERGYRDIEHVVEALEAELEEIRRLRTEKAALLAQQNPKAKSISARIRKVAVTLGIEVSK